MLHINCDGICNFNVPASRPINISRIIQTEQILVTLNYIHIAGNNKLANLRSFARDETFDNHRWNFANVNGTLVCSEVKLLLAVETDDPIHSSQIAPSCDRISFPYFQDY